MSSQRRKSRSPSDPRRTRRSSTARLKRSKKRPSTATLSPQEEDELVRHMTGLQLPQMPSPDTVNANANPPTVRILVVADVDLPSASALAESALAASAETTRRRKQNSTDACHGNDPPLPGAENLLDRVDLCIACGPFCQDDDLRQYYQGRQRKRFLARKDRQQRRMQHHSLQASADSRQDTGQSISHDRHSHPPQRSHSRHRTATSYANHSYPQAGQQTPYESTGYNASLRNTHGKVAPVKPPYYKRTNEENAALEGIMTAALSQLESIVCRVVYVPGRNDPVTTLSNPTATHDSSPPLVGRTHDDSYSSHSTLRLSSTSRKFSRERRLTPNSRNIHRHWLPLAPGLGCGGLLFMDWNSLQEQQPPPLEDGDDEESESPYDDIDALHEDSDEDDTIGSVGDRHRRTTTLNGVTQHLETLQDLDARTKAHGEEYCRSLEQLVKLAPPMSAVTDMPSDSQISHVMKTSLFQTILVSNFHHVEDDQEHLPSNGHSLDDEESFDPPWPTEHESFCARPIVQEHVVLEIASGLNSSGTIVRPMELPKGKLRVVLPGSLRERGEYCLVDVAFMREPKATTNEYRWCVRKTRFHTLNDFV